MKNEGSGLNIMIVTLKSLVNCETFGYMEESFQGTCFGYVFIKACQYVIKFVKVQYHIFPSSLPRKICINL
jgi:hypothetical protein